MNEGVGSLKHHPQRQMSSQVLFQWESVVGRWKQGGKGCDLPPREGPCTIAQGLISPGIEE